jgi:hypothetical protein
MRYDCAKSQKKRRNETSLSLSSMWSLCVKCTLFLTLKHDLGCRNLADVNYACDVPFP